MEWNVWPEYVALTFSLIILIYSQESNVLPTMKNKIFRWCIYVVVFSIIMSIASIYAIENDEIIPRSLNHIVQTIYFLSTPAMSVIFLFYLIAFTMESNQKTIALFKIVLMPYFIYVIIVLTNPVTSLLYYFQEPLGYTNGKGLILVYAMTYLYLGAMIVVILRFGRKIEKSFKLILFSFPAITIVMLFVQQLYNYVVLSGTGATAALLIVYLFLQNKQILIDDLTEFQNRKAFSKVLEANVKHKLDMQIILISLDDFKDVNNKFGQKNGDHILKEISKYLATLFKVANIYRYGGDEFAIILYDEDETSDTSATSRIWERFHSQWQITRVLTCNLTASIAVAKVPKHANTVEDIISLLEYCITQSKTGGKGKVVYSESLIVDKMRRRNKIAEILKTAIRNNGFVVHFQPIYSVKDERFTSAEALVRLYDSDLGQISPVEFIPIAEETGMIIEIGYIVLEQSCKFIGQMDEARIKIDAVSVNFSSLQMYQEGLVPRVLEVIEKNKIDAKRIRIEITESVFIDKIEYMKGIMKEFAQHGIEFYLDDFGTGYSNLSAVIDLPFKYIKMDKSLLYHAMSSDKSFIVTKAFSKAFSDSGMKIVAEGVETPNHKEIVNILKCDYIQGYLYAKPAATSEVIKHFKDFNNSVL